MQTHTGTELLVHAQREYYLVTQQSTTLRLPTVANTSRRKRIHFQEKRSMPAGRKMPCTKCSLPSNSSTQSSSETYVGLATNFKERYRNHTASFRHQSKRNETELSKHIWALKDNNKPFNIKWRIIKQCRPYSNVSNKCNLCLFEKFENHL